MIDKEFLEQALAALPARLSDVQSAQVATLDGIAVADFGAQDNSNRIAAMTSSALALSKRMIETVRAGELAQISVAGSDGHILIYAVGTKAVLVVITKKSPNVALINWEARKVIVEISEMFSG